MRRSARAAPIDASYPSLSLPLGQYTWLCQEYTAALFRERVLNSEDYNESVHGLPTLTAQEWQLRRYPFVIQTCKALQRGDVEAVVYDKTILGHMIKDYGWHELDVLPQTLAVHDYAIALPECRPYSLSSYLTSG
jgi:hypothetical protein